MNVESYIKSGILEAYVAGFLSDAENSEVCVMAEKHPQVKKAIKRIQDKMEFYTQQRESLSPIPSIDSIVLKIAEEEGFIQPKGARRRRWVGYAMATAILVLLLRYYFVYYS